MGFVYSRIFSPVKIPINPPGDWFMPPASGIPTDKRITIEPDGRVFGYVALWDTCHVGLSGCTRPPKGSPTGYEYAHQGETLTASGDLIRTAVIGGGAGHAPQSMKDVAKFYENSGTQMMRVRYGEDSHGLWMAGALWPDVSEIDVARIRASAVSGDWRWHAAWRHTSDGAYDFAGSCLVNIPGFPMPTAEGHVGNQSGAGGLRAIAASAGSGWIITDGEETLSSDDITAGATPAAKSTKAAIGTPWDASAVTKGMGGRKDLRRTFAWVDPNGNPDSQSSYKLPHHEKDGSVNISGVQAAMSRLMQSNTNIPPADKQAVYNHLATHYRQFNKTPPPLKASAGGNMDDPEIVECADCVELDKDAILASMVELAKKHEEIVAAAAIPAIQQSPTSAAEIQALTDRLNTLEQVVTAIASQSLMC